MIINIIRVYRVAGLTELTLRKKIALLAAAGLLLGIGVFAFLSMQALNRSTEAMLQERLTTTRLIADYIDDELGHALMELENTVQGIDVDGLGDSFEAQMKALEGTYSRTAFSILDIFLLDGEGRVVWSRSGHPGLAEVAMSSYPSVAETMVAGGPRISGLVSAPVSEGPAVFLTGSTGEGEKGTRGVLVVAIDPGRSSIGGFIQPIKLGETGYVEIVDQKGVVVARTEPGHELIPFERSDHPERFAELIRAGEPTVGTCHACHEAGQQVERRDVLAFAPLSQAPWGVAIRQSEEEALAPTRELRQRLLLSGVGLLGIALLFVGMTTRDVVRRIRVLTAACRRITEGDLAGAVAPLGKDEIGTLAQTFDGMRVKLKRSYDDLERRTKEMSALYEELQHREEMQRELLRQVISAQEEERRRIARGLHDETSQALTSFTVSLETAIASIPPGAAKATAKLREMQSLAVRTLEEIQRVVYELRPTVLDDLGLIAAVQWHVENYLEPAGVQVHFETVGQERRLPAQVATALFRIVQEAATNIIRHANAESASISLEFMESSVAVHIEDDGGGFDLGEVMSKREGGRGLGLLGMKERAEFLGGVLTIRARPGLGTQIDVKVPVNEVISDG